MFKKIIKETWLDFLTIFLVVIVGIWIAIELGIIELILIPIFIGLIFGSKPYVKIRMIMEDKNE